MYKKLSDRELFDSMSFSTKFEFMSPLDREKLAHKLAKHTRKNVEYSNSYSLGDAPDAGKLYLYPNFFGGERMHAVQTGMLPYNEALHTALTLLSFIEGYGFTTNKCKTSIEFTTDGSGSRIMDINPLKLILNIDENSIIKKWYDDNPERIYRSPIIKIYPKNMFMHGSDVESMIGLSPSDLILPISSKFGIDFKKIRENKLKVRYIGGRNYHKKKKDFVEFIDETIQIINRITSSTAYNDTELCLIKRMLSEQKAVLDSLCVYDNFVKNYPGIELQIDLKENKEYLRSIKYNDLREGLFYMIAYGSVKEGCVNYDSIRNSFQIKNARIKNGIHLDRIEFFDSFIEGEMTDCKLMNCTVRNSKMVNCEAFSSNTISHSYISECSFHGLGNKIKSSYLKNSPTLLIEADIEDSVIGGGTVSYGSSIDKLTEILS